MSLAHDWIERNSKDKTVNQYGKKLIEVCKHCNIIILNGRSESDQKGECTCKNISVVDYCISNINCLRYIHDVKILSFSQFLSDVHNPIEVSLVFFSECSKRLKYQEKQQKEIAKCWNPEKGKCYHDAVEDKAHIIAVLENKIKDTKGDQVSTEFIDNIVENIGNILVECAKDTFGKK